MLLLYAAFGAVSLVASVLLIVLFRRWKVEDRLVVASLPLAAAVIAPRVVARIFLLPQWDWNAARLLPAFAVAHGYPLYSAPGDGPLFPSGYGRLGMMVYLPAVLASTPTGAVLIGGVITVLLTAGPVLWLFLAAARRQADRALLAMGLFSLFLFFVFGVRGLDYSCFNIHTDAPALALGALACGVLFSGRAPYAKSTLLLSAALAALSIWAKQTTAPLLVAIPLYLVLVEGWRPALFFAGASGAIALGLLAVMVLAFGVPAMRFSLTSQESHPLTVRSADDVLSIVHVLLRYVLPFLTAVFAYVLWERTAPVAQERRTLREWLREQRWALFAVVAMGMFPVSVLGRLKEGGADNQYSITLYFLLCAFGMLLLHAASFPHRPAVARAVKFLVALGVMAHALYWAYPTYRMIADLPPHVRDNPQQMAFEYAKAHPGTVYFPWNVLSSFMAEGKLYHFSYAVKDAEMAGYPLTREYIRAYLPRDFRFVAFYAGGRKYGNTPDRYMLRHLKEFKRRITLIELRGWNVYARRTPAVRRRPGRSAPRSGRPSAPSRFRRPRFPLPRTGR